jgi:signal transduction histidine kinase
VMKHALLPLLCLVCLGSQAQLDPVFFKPVAHSELDSLAALLKGAPPDTLYLGRLARLAYVQQFYHDTIGEYNAKLVKERALQLHYKKAIWQADMVLTAPTFERKDFTGCFSLYEEGLRLIDPEKEYMDLVRFRAGFLNLLFFTGDYPRALTESLKGLDLARKNSDSINIASYTNLLGFIHFHQGNLEQAKKYYTSYLLLASQAGDKMQVANACSNLADVYNEEKNYHDALEQLSHALSIYKDKGSKPHIALTYYNLARTYKLKGELQKAMDHLDAALDISEVHLANKYDLAAFYLLQGEIRQQQGHNPEAITAFRKGLGIAEEIGHRQDIKDACLDLSNAFSAGHQSDSAFFYYKRYAVLKDSLLNEKSIQEISGMQARYDLSKKDQEITLLNNQKELAEAESRRSGLLRNSIIAISILLAGFAWIAWRQQQLRQRSRAQQEANRQQQELFNAVITTQEKERKRIAENLHDGIGSLLSTIKLSLERMEEGSLKLDAAQLEHYRNSLTILNDAITELRNVSHNIMPAALSKLGLAAALRQLFSQVSATSSIRLELLLADEDVRTDEQTELGIYHIVLELVNNIVRHSEARSGTVQLIRFPSYISITAEDDGKGFDIRQGRAKKGIGLGNIESRVNYLGGKMDIDSSPGNGTTILIELPLK